jgi:hypothetical protein
VILSWDGGIKMIIEKDKSYNYLGKPVCCIYSLQRPKMAYVGLMNDNGIIVNSFWVYWDELKEG